MTSSDGVELIGFDVFDTVVTRRVHAPRDLFPIVARRLGERGLLSVRDLDGWCHGRIRCERMLRQAGASEVRLGEIYKALAADWGWGDREAELASLIEVAIEDEFMAPVAETIARIRQMQASGRERPVLISDFYMTAEQLSGLLNRHLGPDTPTLYVSSESRATKSSGALFRFVKEAEAPNSLKEHYGDNLRSDVRAARAHGLHARQVRTALPSRYERALASAGGLEGSLAAGCARAARVGRTFPDPRDALIWSIGANVIGPFIGGYVLWVLQQAQALGLKRLYFVARDGQVMLRLAKPLAEALGGHIECRYLHGSRQAWHAAALDLQDDALPSWLTEACTGIEAALIRLGFERAEAAGWAGSAPAASDLPGQIRALMQTGDFRERMQAIIRERRQLAADYLRQEGVLDGVPFAVVDVGWVGRAQRSLESLIRRELGLGPCHAFYIGLQLPSSDESPNALRHRYMTCSPDLGSQVVHLRHDLIEIICAADHGGVQGYRRESAQEIAPVLREPPGAYEARLIALQQEAAESFVRELCLAMHGARASWTAMARALRRGGAQVLGRFGVWPSAEEAEAYGRFRHDVSQEGQPPSREFAPRGRLSGGVGLLRSPWREGSVSRSVSVGWLRTALQSTLFTLNVARRWRRD